MTSLMKSLSVLALAGSALAISNDAHGRVHAPQHAYGSAPIGTGGSAPYPIHAANCTEHVGPTGTGTSSSTVSLSSESSGSSSVAPYSSVPVSQTLVSSASYTAIVSSSTTSSITSSIAVVPSSYVNGNGGSGSSPASGYASGEGVCSWGRSTITTTTKVYITVTAEACSSSSSETESSVLTSSTSIAIPTTPAEVIPNSSSTSTPPVVSYSPPQESPSSSYVVSAPTVSLVPVTSAPASSAPSTVPSSIASPPSTTTSESTKPTAYGKRGLAYNDVSLTQYFAGNDLVTWAYNWMSNSDGDLPNGVEYIPTLHGTSSEYTTGWMQAANEAISNGAKHVFTFNEPDYAHENPAQVAAVWEQYVQPLSGKAQLGAPSVTNGGAPMGLTWLSQFMDACSSCDIDFVNIHWYAALDVPDFDAASNFKQHLQEAYSTSGKPMYVTEFGPSSPTTSAEAISTFLQDVMPWMDAQDWVLGYSYFMVQQGSLVNGNEPSSFGRTFATYTG